MLLRMSRTITGVAISPLLIICVILSGEHTAISATVTSPDETAINTPSIETQQPPGKTDHTDSTATPSEVEIVLTFDDGPHTDSLGSGQNYTENIMKTLANNRVQNHIKAAFFVQTHVSYRGRCRLGGSILTLAHKSGHLIAIHTGSATDHTLHKFRAVAPAYDVDEDSDSTADGQNGLESDVIGAKMRIRQLTDELPTFIRAPIGPPEGTSQEVFATYSRQELKHIYWDVDSYDSHPDDYTPAQIEQLLYHQVQYEMDEGNNRIIVLFHDVNFQTQANLEHYLQKINEAVEAKGKIAEFVTSRNRIKEIFQSRDNSIPLHWKRDVQPVTVALTPLGEHP